MCVRKNRKHRIRGEVSVIIKWLYMYIFGYVSITVEGLFIERFINICISKSVVLLDLHREKSTIVKTKIIKSDFKKLKKIARQTKCRVYINKKTGIPFLLNKYRKRKVFVIAVFIIAIILFIITRFIWNIEISGLEKIPEHEILYSVNNMGIAEGKLRYEIDKEKIINQLRLERDDLAWVGIDVRGTNVVISLVEAIKKPEIVDISEVCNIVSNKDAVISKIVVQNGTARVKAGDNIKVGDMLVEGVLEGQYTGARYVHAQADIYANIYYEKEGKESLVQEIEVKTGNEEKKIEIYIKNFKINFNKGVSKFENYDTIRTTKKLKLFSNYYIPVEIVQITNIETNKEYKKYTENELKEKLARRLEEELDKEIADIVYEKINKELVLENIDDVMNVKLVYEIQEKIGIKQK